MQKHFEDGNDQLATTLNIRCNSGLPLEQSFEVLSFGVSGYSTAQELLALRQHVWQFDPDIVLITVDTLRRDHVSIYGASPFGEGPPVQTPSFDAFARGGVLAVDAAATFHLYQANSSITATPQNGT